MIRIVTRLSAEHADVSLRGLLLVSLNVKTQLGLNTCCKIMNLKLLLIPTFFPPHSIITSQSPGFVWRVLPASMRVSSIRQLVLAICS